MSKKAIDKEYLLNQLQNFESNILDPKYLDESDIEPLSTADIEAIKAKFNPTTYVVPEASPTTSGLMTPADKIKLNNISNNANNVLFDQELNDGTLIGTLTIDGVDNNLYAPASLSESDIAEMGFTKNTGTITGITMNGASKTVTGGVVDLGTVITEHQDISGKVDKNGTDSLMTADEHTKLAGIATGAEVNVQSDWNQTTSSADDYIKNKPALGTAAAKDVPSSGNASTTQVVMGNDTRLSDARNAADVYDWAKASTKPAYTAVEVGAIPTTAKGAASGVAELDANGKVPSSQLPSYVDDVLEYTAKANFPTTGETGKIYLDTTTNLQYRWSGTAYVEISPSLALGETSSTAYRGDRGKTAYDHASAKGSAFSSGLYKITTNAEGHVTAASAVVKSDITGLGIPGSLLPSGGTKDQILVKQSNTNDDADWETVEALSNSDIEAIKAKFSPNYSELPTATIGAAGLMSAADKAKLNSIETNAEANIQADWNQTSSTAKDFIKNKPTIPSAVAVKGDAESTYRIGNVNITKANIGLSNVGNFKAVSTVASQGLTDTEKSNARANIGAGTSSFSGNYNDLSNKPTIPTVNNATLTIQKNGTNVKTFTANASTDVTANITVPTKVSELTNDSGFTTNTGTVTQVKIGSTAYNPSNGIVSLPSGIAIPSGGSTGQILKKNSNTDGDTGWETVEALSSSDIDSIKSKFQPSYSDLPIATISNNGLMSSTDKSKLNGIAAGAEVNVQADWNVTDSSSDAFIKNKPTIPAAQVNADWNASSGKAQILNKPTVLGASPNGEDPSLVTNGEKYEWSQKVPLETLYAPGDIITSGIYEDDRYPRLVKIYQLGFEAVVGGTSENVAQIGNAFDSSTIFGETVLDVWITDGFAKSGNSSYMLFSKATNISIDTSGVLTFTPINISSLSSLRYFFNIRIVTDLG